MAGSILGGISQDITLADVLHELEQIRAALGYNSNGLMGVTVGNAPSVAQSGTWTVQPGNTANTTAWLTTLAASSTSLYGPVGTMLDQHYQSMSAFDAIRTKITVS